PGARLRRSHHARRQRFAGRWRNRRAGAEAAALAGGHGRRAGRLFQRRGPGLSRAAGAFAVAIPSDPSSGAQRPAPAGAKVRVLGIDPGSQRTGVGIIDIAGDGKVTHVHHQPLVLLDAETFPLRLRKLLDGLWALIEQYAPDEVAVEQVFLSNN